MTPRARRAPPRPPRRAGPRPPPPHRGRGPPRAGRPPAARRRRQPGGRPSSNGHRQPAKSSRNRAPASSKLRGSSLSTGTRRPGGMARAALGATRSSPSNSKPSPTGSSNAKVVSPLMRARWRSRIARENSLRKGVVSARAATTGTTSGRTTRASGTTLRVRPPTTWSASTVRTSESSSAAVARVLNSLPSTSADRAYQDSAAAASSSAVTTTSAIPAPRRPGRAVNPGGAGPTGRLR